MTDLSAVEQCSLLQCFLSLILRLKFDHSLHLFYNYESSGIKKWNDLEYGMVNNAVGTQTTYQLMEPRWLTTSNQFNV